MYLVHTFSSYWWYSCFSSSSSLLYYYIFGSVFLFPPSILYFDKSWRRKILCFLLKKHVIIWNYIYILFICHFTRLNLHDLCRSFAWLIIITHCDGYSWNATYESLLGTRQPLPKPIPLSVSVLCIFTFPCWDCLGQIAKLLICDLIFNK